MPTEFFAEHGALIGPLVVTCIVSLGTPGPNNLIVLSATLSDTRRAALKAYLGVCLGFPPMVLIVSLAAAHFVESISLQLNLIKYLGIAFLLYLSAKLFLAPPTGQVGHSGTAPGFLFMVLFQWTNPKALAMASSMALSVLIMI